MLGKYLLVDSWFFENYNYVALNWISKNLITCLDDSIIIYEGYQS
jgi:hypothetical protein